MALPPFWANQEAVPEGLKEHVKAGSDGRIYLDVTPAEGFALENVTSLRSGLQAARAERDAAQTKLKGYQAIDEYGVPIPELVEGHKKLKEGYKPPKELEAALAAKDAEWKKKYDTDLGGAKDRGDKLETELRKVRMGGAIDKAIEEAGGDPFWLRDKVMERCRLVGTDDGQHLVRVLDENGNPRISDAPGSSDYMGVKEYVLGLKKDPRYGPGFPGTKVKGGATDPNDGAAQRTDPQGRRVVSDSESVNPNDIISGKVVRQGAL